jgi:hypothetical protein
MSRRHAKILQDDELNADEEAIELDAEESRDSPTDNEDGPVQNKKVDARRQEEEEEEEGEGQAVTHHPGARSDLPNREQATERQTETGPRTKTATRRSRVSLGEAPEPKRRRTVSLIVLFSALAFSPIS